MSFQAPSLQGKRVLITGGLGFIGSNLAHRCLRLGAQVTLYDCLDPRSGGNMQNVAEIHDALEIVLNDVRNFEGLCSAILRQDIVFSCAAYTSHPQSMRDPLTDIEVNCKGIINLLEAARRFNPTVKIVHVGTSTQMGPMRYKPMDENHPEFPLDIYSANKSVSEKYVLIYASAYHLPACVVRLANVFGPRSNIRSAEFGFMNYFIGLGLQDKPIPVFGAGDQMRNITFVADAVEALISAATQAASDGEVFFAVSREQHDVASIADAISRCIGGTVQRVEWPAERAAIEIGDVEISDEKIRHTLGWSAQHDMESGLLATAEYYRGCLSKYLD